MKDTCQKIVFLGLLALTSVFFYSSFPRITNASSDLISAFVKVSVCGNEIQEDGEDCDNQDLQNRSCSSLGYTGGILGCDISCSFNTSSCTLPSIEPENVSPDDLSSLLAVGYFDIPNTASIISTPSLTTTTEVVINVSTDEGTSTVILPDELVITRSDDQNLDPSTLTTSTVTTTSVSGLAEGNVVEGALQWGLEGISLEFSVPITISLYVGDALNGSSLDIIRSTDLSSGWTNEGIVAPAACTVTTGLCAFQTTKASYFATTRSSTPTSTPTPTQTPVSTQTPTPGPSSTPTPGPSSTPTPQITNPTVTPTSSSSLNIPEFLQPYLTYLDKKGKIKMDGLYNVVKSWVENWQQSLEEELASLTGTPMQARTVEKCDVNQDRTCNLKDLSILLFYVEK